MKHQSETRSTYKSGYQWLRAKYHTSEASNGQVALFPASVAALSSFQAKETMFTGWRNAERFDHWQRLRLHEWLHHHQCNHENCPNFGVPCWLPDSDYDGPPDYYFCPEHAKDEGFCYGCGTFWVGVESFDFGDGIYCPNCASEYEDDYDDWDEEWSYPEWQDILTDETGGRYIGPGSDYVEDSET